MTKWYLILKIMYSDETVEAGKKARFPTHWNSKNSNKQGQIDTLMLEKLGQSQPE